MYTLAGRLRFLYLRQGVSAAALGAFFLAAPGMAAAEDGISFPIRAGEHIEIFDLGDLGEGIGAIDFGADSVDGTDRSLILSAIGGRFPVVFEYDFVGKGTVILADSNVVFDTTVDNSGFSGIWNIGDTGNLNIVNINQFGSADINLNSSGVFVFSNAGFNEIANIGNKLIGTGIFSLALGSGATINLTGANDGFAGLLELYGGQFTLEGNNQKTVERATLFIGLTNGQRGTVTVGAGRQVVKNITLNNGMLAFKAGVSNPMADGYIEADMFRLTRGIINVQAGNTAVIDNDLASGSDNLLRIDDVDQYIQLVKANTVIGSVGDNITQDWNGFDGKRAIQENGETVADAEFSYQLVTGKDGGPVDGLYVKTRLARVVLADSKTLTLKADELAQGEDAAFSAEIAGAGNLAIDAGKAIGKTITLSHTNSYTGSTTVKAGSTLLLGADQALGATGSLIVDAAATVDFGSHEQVLRAGAVDGVLQSDSGKLVFTGGSGEFVINTANAGLRAAATINEGATVRLANAGGLGASTLLLDGNLDFRTVSTGGATFNNALTGHGVFTVALGDVQSSFYLGEQVGAGFEGTLALETGSFSLSGNNAAALANATLQIGAGNITAIMHADTVERIHGLTLGGGELRFDGIEFPSGVTDKSLLEVDDLTLLAGTVTDIRVNKAEWVWDVPPAEEIQARNILDQDNPSIALIKVKNNINRNGGEIRLIDQTGDDFLDEARQDIAIKNTGGEDVATGSYDWNFSFYGASEAEKGLYIGYGLRKVAIHEGKTLTFEPDQGASGAATIFSARVVDRDAGSGTLRIVAAPAGNGRIVTLDNDSNAFTANIDVVSGTLRLGAHHALGQDDMYTKGVALLNDGTALDVNGKGQTIGFLTTAAGSMVDLKGGHLTIADGGRAEGTFKGTGRLDFSGGSFAIDSSSMELAAGVAIAADAEVRLGNMAGLGAGAAISNSGRLVFAGVKGDQVRAVDGNGTVALTDGADVNLSAANGLAGTWRLDAGTRLAASDGDQLGTAVVENSGTLVAAAGNGKDWVLGNSFSGSGSLLKEGAGTVTIGAANAGHTGAVTIADGVLVLGHQNAVGANGIITINGGAGLKLDFAADAAFEKQFDGAGVAEIAGGTGVVTTIAADNSGYGGTWSVTGHGRVTESRNLGKGAVAIGETGRLDVITTGDVRFDNVLQGKGILYASNGGGAFDLGGGANGFEGTLWLEDNTFRLDGGNTGALNGATLRIGNGNVTSVGRNSQKIGGLVIDSGSRLVFGDTFVPGSIVAENVIETGALEIRGEAAIQANVRDKVMNPPAGGENLQAGNILAQDDGTQELQFVRLAEGRTVVGGAGQLKLLDENGVEIDLGQGDVDLEIVDGDGVVAKGRYGLGFGTGKDNDGLYVSYKLKELDIQDGRTLVLHPDDGAGAGGVKLEARLTGSGNVEINANARAGNVVVIANGGNDYTGTTTISSGILQMESDNALGQSSHLTINDGTRLHINGDYRQVLRGLDAAGDNALSGRGELVFMKDAASGSGIFTIDGKNTGLAADVTIESGAQAILKQTSGLGVGGRVTLADDATLTFAGAKGELQKGIFGDGGTIALTDAADLTLMAQGAFNGTWDVEQKARLTATADNQLGTGDINLAGDATLRIDTAADWTFGNKIAAADDSTHFVKEGTGYLTVNDILAAFEGDISINGGALIVDGGADADEVTISARHVTVGTGGILSGRGIVDSTVTNHGVITAWNALDSVRRLDGGGQEPPGGTLHFMNGLKNMGTLQLSGDEVGNWITITGGLQAGAGSKLVISIAAGSNGLLDDDAQKDMLVLDGGTTTGETLVTVIARDGGNVETTNGILVVRVDNGAVVGSGAFRLDPNAANYRKETNTLRFSAYDYQYQLVRKTVNGLDGWHLVTAGTEIGGGGDDAYEGASRWLSPEAAVTSSLQSANRNMFMMRMSDHEGRQMVMTQGRESRRVWSMWSRFDGGHSSMGFSGGTGVDYNRYRSRLGVDLAGFDLGGRGSLYAGVMSGWGHDRFSSSRGAASAKGRSDGYSGGVYATWYSNDREQKQGGYVDGWLQYGYYDNDAKGAGSFKAHSWTGSVEAGYKFRLFDGDSSEFSVTPQAQLAYIEYDTSRFYTSNPFMDMLGIKPRFGNNDGIAGRVGVRFDGAAMLGNNVILKPFGMLDWHYDEKPGKLYFGSDIISSAVPRNIGEVSLGVETAITQNLHIWGQGSASFGKNNYEAYKGSLGMKMKW